MSRKNMIFKPILVDFWPKKWTSNIFFVRKTNILLIAATTRGLTLEIEEWEADILSHANLNIKRFKI